MQTTGRSRRDGVVAATVALAVNGWLAWQLHALLSPQRAAMHDAPAALQVVWIAAVPRQAAVVAPAGQQAVRAHASPAIVRPPPAQPRPDTATAPGHQPEIAPARPMTAVYLQQARQWAQQRAGAELAGTDALADRVTDLPGRPTEHFRMAEPLSVAIVVDRIGQAFGNGPHPCIRNRQDVAAYATGGDALALQMALDTERRCRP